MSDRQSISVEVLKAKCVYDAHTGAFTWRENHGRVKAGTPVGCLKPNGHWVVNLTGGTYTVQRLVWLYAYGEMPKGKIKFKNKDTQDFSLENLVEYAYVKNKFDHSDIEQRRAYNRAHRAANPDHYKSKDLQKSFGITLVDYENMLVEQNGVCACCTEPEKSMRNGRLKRLAVDHDHDTGELRGLLCSLCNPMIGYAQEDRQRLLDGVRYLDQHKPKSNSLVLINETGKFKTWGTASVAIPKEQGA